MTPSAPAKGECLFGCGLLVLVAVIGSIALGSIAAVVASLVQMGWEAVR